MRFTLTLTYPIILHQRVNTSNYKFPVLFYEVKSFVIDQPLQVADITNDIVMCIFLTLLALIRNNHKIENSIASSVALYCRLKIQFVDFISNTL